MKVAILCTGPSLKGWDAGTWREHDVTIAVNRAIHYTRCQIWIFGDRLIYRELPVTVPTTIWTQSEQISAMRDEGGFDPGPHRWHTYPELYDRYPCVMDGMTWPTFTLPSAYILAASLGATQIDVFGDDRTDAPDFDGRNHHGARGENRWADQALFERPVIRRLVSDGIKINRLQP